MRNFQLIATNVDVIPTLNALACHSDLWDQERLRTTHPLTPHHQVSDIILRFNDLKLYRASGDVSDILDEHESINHPAMFMLPQVRPILFDLMRRVEGERLGRVIITRMAPGTAIDPHIDGGEHAAYYDRYHVTLQNNPGSTFICGQESVYMTAGQVWWFNNAITHSVVNNSVDDRITLIVDIRTFR